MKLVDNTFATILVAIVVTVAFAFPLSVLKEDLWNKECRIAGGTPLHFQNPDQAICIKSDSILK